MPTLRDIFLVLKTTGYTFGMGRTVRKHIATRRRLAANIERLRQKKNWSLADLAGAARVSRSLVYEARDRLRGISIDTLGFLAEALGCDVVDLLDEQR